MYQAEHIIYIFGSLFFIILCLWGAHFIKNQRFRNCFLLFWAFVCLGIHLSTIYTSFFNQDGLGTACANQLFPVFFCNLCMDMLVICSLWSNKKTKFFKFMATFTAYAGVFGALITLFSTPPGFSSWSTLESALAHSCLLMGCGWLFVGGYVKIHVYNLVPYIAGIAFSGVVGLGVELIFWLKGLPSPNAMFLFNGPEELPEMKCWMFVLAMLAIMFVFTAVWEQATRKKEDRWYKTLGDLRAYFK